ncbi:MAG: hypothetical protein KBS99_04830 [Prevotellaceae bacterium]|nr:hypothetical protein [Candidatus Colivivens caballi]
MKKYIQPHTRMITVNTQSIICTSPIPIGGSLNNPTADGKRRGSDDDYDPYFGEDNPW